MVVYIHGNNLEICFDDVVHSIDKSYMNAINLFIQIFIAEGVSRSAVPLFFLLSGYLFFISIHRYESFHDFFLYKIKHRCMTIVLPYLFWSIFGLLLLFLFQNIPLINNYILHDNLPILKELTISDILTVITYRPVPYQLWFLRDLITMNILSPLIFYQIKYCPSFNYIMLFFLTLIWFFNVQLHFICIETPLFFYIGSAIALKDIKQKELSRGIIYLLLLLWIIFLSTYAFLIIFYKFNYFPWLQRIFAFWGMVAIWYLYNIIPFFNSNIFKQVSAYTFIIFVAHEPILTLLKALSVNMFLKGLNYYNSFSLLILYLCLPIFVINITIVFGYFFKKLFPQFYTLVTGDR